MRAHRKLAVICLGALVLLLGCCIFFASRGVVSRLGASSISQTLGNNTGTPVLPSDELFLPEEPDFVPDFIPEREQRTIWTRAEAEPYWIDPLSEVSEKYINMIDAAIDNLMEQVP